MCIFTKPGEGFVWLWQYHSNKECWQVLNSLVKNVDSGIGEMTYIHGIHILTYMACIHTHKKI